MELKFDNEIDAILRGVAKEPNFANSPTEHLDADEISLFAENVLSGDARLRAVSHLADCNRCRIILTNVVKLNYEVESEVVHTVATPIVETKQLSWFEKLFTLPNLAYTMGGLILVFAGFIGFSVLQNNKSESTVAKIEQVDTVQSKGTSGASSEGEAKETDRFNANTATNSTMSAANTVANAPMAAANASASTNSVAINQKNSVSNSALTNSTVANKPQSLDLAKKSSDKSDAVQAEPEKSISESNVKPLTTPQPKTDLSTNDMLKNVPDTAIGGERKFEVEDKKETTRGAIKRNKDEQTALGALPPASAPIPNTANARKNSTESSNANSQSVGGKTFRNVKGVWTDSAYTGGSTKKVKRNSKDYKKLDSGLQNIGNSLGGTVIVVWNGKNYKIQ